jgi:septal ring factor EnvC (AmiA/AmiB activator)
MDAKKELEKCYNYLGNEYKELRQEFKAEWKVLATIKDLNQKVLKFSECTFDKSFTLSKELLTSLYGTFVMIEKLEKSVANSNKKIDKKIEDNVKKLESENTQLKEELAAIVKDIKYLKGRILFLGSRPPGGGGQAAARVPIRQSKI